MTPGIDFEVVRTQAVGTDSAVAGTEVVGIGTAERRVGTGTAAAKARCCTLAVGLIR